MMTKLKLRFPALVALLLSGITGAALANDAAVYKGQRGPGKGKHIVFLSGDEEYRSEEALPMLAKILAVRHGFKCTVLFSTNPTNNTIDPLIPDNIPGMEALDSADLCVMLLRFRELPDAQMKHFVDYVNRGKPIIGLRTSTHAFAYRTNPQSEYARYDWKNKEWPGGFGQQVLGETWVNHHGNHGKESTRGVINDEFRSHPIVRGATDIWGPTDVYTVAHLSVSQPTPNPSKEGSRTAGTRRSFPSGEGSGVGSLSQGKAQVLVWGEVLTGMKPTDRPVEGPKNNPMMPLVWVRDYTGDQGKTSKIVTTTMGASVDLESEGLRRLIVNACYWAVGREKKIPANANVAYVGEYKPTWFGFGKFTPGLKPEDLELKQ